VEGKSGYRNPRGRGKRNQVWIIGGKQERRQRAAEGGDSKGRTERLFWGGGRPQIRARKGFLLRGPKRRKRDAAKDIVQNQIKTVRKGVNYKRRFWVSKVDKLRKNSPPRKGGRKGLIERGRKDTHQAGNKKGDELWERFMRFKQQRKR